MHGVSEEQEPSGPSNRQSLSEQEQALLPSDPSEQQALAIFDHAGEEIRFFKSQQWQVTNYALAAYAALVVAPPLVEPHSWRSWTSLGAFVLVGLAFAAALWVLANLELSIEKERRRQRVARDHLLLMREIHREHSLKTIRSEMRWRRWFRKLHHELDTDRGPPVKRIFVLVLVVGLLVASVINLSRIPWVVAYIGQSASVGGPWPSS